VSSLRSNGRSDLSWDAVAAACLLDSSLKPAFGARLVSRCLLVSRSVYHFVFPLVCLIHAHARIQSAHSSYSCGLSDGPTLLHVQARQVQNLRSLMHVRLLPKKLPPALVGCWPFARAACVPQYLVTGTLTTALTSTGTVTLAHTSTGTLTSALTSMGTSPIRSCRGLRCWTWY
jgi:hypothetical protein